MFDALFERGRMTATAAPELSAAVRRRLRGLPEKETVDLSSVDLSSGPVSPEEPIPEVDEPAPPRLHRGHVAVAAAVLAVGLIGAFWLYVAQRPVAEDVASMTDARAGAQSPAPGQDPGAAGEQAPPAPDGRSGQVGQEGPSDQAGRNGAPAVAPTPTVLAVHVVGKVGNPGVVHVEPGARVADAIAAAGGTEPDVDHTLVNLARPVVDGEQIFVGITPPPGLPEPPVPHPPGGPGGPADGSPGDLPAPLLDLNLATAEELQALPGVGPVLAGRILDYRAERGGFTAIEELREVSGIGDRRFEELNSKVFVP